MPAITIDQALRLAAQYRNSGNLAAAETMYRQILAVAPEHDGALHQLGVCVLSAGRHQEALQWLSRAAAQVPASPEYQCDLGVVHCFLNRPEEAVRCFEKALQIAPNFAAASSNLSETLLRLGRIDEAIASGQRAVAAQPNFAEAHNNLGNALRDKRRLDEAVQHFFRALAINPQFADAHNNLAYAYLEMDRWDDALASCQQALALDPGLIKAWLNRGTAYMGKGEVVEAERSFRRAIACQPDYADGHWNLSIALLLSEQYEEGWREFEWRRHSSIRNILGGLQQDPGIPPWDGRPVEGASILVYAEQGLGDTIQFARYLPLVRDHARARRVVFLCPSALEDLFTASGGWNADILAPCSDDPPPVLELDHHISITSLPLVLRQFVPSPPANPYLRTDPEKRASWRARLRSSSRVKVGVVWQGNPRHADDRRRSLDPCLLAPLLRVPEVDVYSLQITTDAKKAAATDLPEGLIDLTAHIADFTDTAAFMEELDLIISVDTSTAHLAGALGRPVWTLLPFAPDWRWGLGSESTPWYSTMRLFRQKATGAWEEVIERIVEALPSFCAARR